MTSRTPFFRAFGPLLFGRRGRSTLASLSKLESLEDLYAIFGDLFAERLLERSDKGTNSRRRSLPPQVTFWAFVAQALSPKTSCREVVRRVEAWRRWGQLRSGCSITDSAYIQARQRLDLSTLRLIRGQVAWTLERTVLKEERWLEGREVKIVDGTSFSMPDTAANQAVWPQPSGQQPGCGFPVAKMVGLFSLSSGALLEECVGDLHNHDSLLLASLWDRLSKGDIVLGDRGFCSYGAMAALLGRGVDTVMRLHSMRKVDLRRGKRLGPGDQLVEWSRPAQPPLHVTPAQWKLLPQKLAVRLIRVVVETPGFRTRHVLIATTLTDAARYPADALRELYARRWTIELHFAQIKTILGLDVLRCQSPDMIGKELQIHLIAYNLVRALMQKAAHFHHMALDRISFKGTLDTLRHWAAAIHASSKTPRKQAELIGRMLEAIAADPLPLRPGRTEPRAKKRRPKTHQLLTQPRHQMKVTSHRGKHPASRPKTALS
jgi:Transposase DDE domain/Insertion element 4 transposase N-terminal